MPLGPELVSTVGFPIAVSIMLFKLYRDEREDRREERKELREERKKFRNAIDTQTQAFRSLVNEIGSDEGTALTDGGERE